MRIVCCAVIIASLSACGFQLRGSYQLPTALQQLTLDVATKNGELARTLRRSLDSAGVEVLEQGGAPKLVVSEVRQQRRILAVDTAGNPKEYELSATVDIVINETSKGYSLPSRKLSVRRDYIYESTGVLSSSDQEAQLKIDMERELARRIMRVLHAAQ